MRESPYAERAQTPNDSMSPNRREFHEFLVGGILWIVFYDMSLRPCLHFCGLFLFFGLPFLISLMLYYTWEMRRHIQGIRLTHQYHCKRKGVTQDQLGISLSFPFSQRKGALLFLLEPPISVHTVLTEPSRD